MSLNNQTFVRPTLWSESKPLPLLVNHSRRPNAHLSAQRTFNHEATKRGYFEFTHTEIPDVCETPVPIYQTQQIPHEQLEIAVAYACLHHPDSRPQLEPYLLNSIARNNDEDCKRYLFLVLARDDLHESLHSFRDTYTAPDLITEVEPDYYSMMFSSLEVAAQLPPCTHTQESEVTAQLPLLDVPLSTDELETNQPSLVSVPETDQTNQLTPSTSALLNLSMYEALMEGLGYREKMNPPAEDFRTQLPAHTTITTTDNSTTHPHPANPPRTEMKGRINLGLAKALLATTLITGVDAASGPLTFWDLALGIGIPTGLALLAWSWPDSPDIQSKKRENRPTKARQKQKEFQSPEAYEAPFHHEIALPPPTHDTAKKIEIWIHTEEQTTISFEPLISYLPDQQTFITAGPDLWQIDDDSFREYWNTPSRRSSYGDASFYLCDWASQVED